MTDTDSVMKSAMKQFCVPPKSIAATMAGALVEALPLGTMKVKKPLPRHLYDNLVEPNRRGRFTDTVVGLLDKLSVTLWGRIDTGRVVPIGLAMGAMVIAGYMWPTEEVK